MEYIKISDKVIHIIRDISGVETVSFDDDLIGDIIIDSLTVVLLINTIEEEFNICFSDDLDMNYLDSVTLLIDTIFEKLKE